MAKHNTNTNTTAAPAAQAPVATPVATPAAAPPANPLAAVVAATLAAHASAVAMAKPAVPVVHASTIVRPVAAVHAICAAVLEAAPNTTRGQLIAQCVEAGIATATAKTQIQVFLAGRKVKPVAVEASQA